MAKENASLRTKIVNLSIIGSLVAVLCVGAVYYGRSTVPPAEIIRMYHSMFGDDIQSVIRYPYTSSEPEDLYLNLMKLTLMDLIYDNPAESRKLRQAGLIWPSRALTMISLQALDNLQTCMEDVIARGTPGDFIEALPRAEDDFAAGERLEYFEPRPGRGQVALLIGQQDQVAGVQPGRQ